MTIVVSLRVNDGIVLAADSATTISNTASGEIIKVYNNQNKIFNLLKGYPIGAMTYGSGSIGKASISTISKDFRVELSRAGHEYSLDPEAYTIEDIAKKARKFFSDLFAAEYPAEKPKNFGMGYRVGGYSAGAPMPEVWEILLTETGCTEPSRLYEDDHFGPRWAGETEALDRLILGVGSNFETALVEMGVDAESASSVHRTLVGKLYAKLYDPAMPIQDAIDLTKFLAGTAARFSHFSLRAPTVGGPIEIATITKHEGFKWVARKHYYSVEFNPEPSHD